MPKRKYSKQIEVQFYDDSDPFIRLFHKNKCIADINLGGETTLGEVIKLFNMLGLNFSEWHKADWGYYCYLPNERNQETGLDALSHAE